MILSRKDLEEIAAAVIKDFNLFIFKVDDSHNRVLPQATPIDLLAEKYLGLKVLFAPLSLDGTLCGLTAYADTEYQIVKNGVPQKMSLRKNEVVLNQTFLEAGSVRRLCGKRRFTLAHECAHQILFQLESDGKKSSCRRVYEKGRVYSARELKSREDWNEWQANVLGAAILMPYHEIDLAMQTFANGRCLKKCGDWFDEHDKPVITMLCHFFGVSRTAMTIRLAELGYVEEQTFSEQNETMLEAMA